MKDADLRNANLFEADLQGSNLSNADLRGANLEAADLRNANLHGADLRGADLHGVDFDGADLQDARLDEDWTMCVKSMDAVKNMPLQFEPLPGELHEMYMSYVNEEISCAGCQPENEPELE